MSTVLTTIPNPATPLPSIKEIKQRRSDRAGRQPEEVRYDNKAYTARLLFVLLVAAALGCGVGFWAYRQLPAPVVPMTLYRDASGVVVTWPTGQTRQAVYAAIRLNDGPPQPLTPDEKTAGAVHIGASPGSNFKLELIVQHWLRDSRGIVRFVSAAPLPSAGQQLTR
jgi:hypothetical protein